MNTIDRHDDDVGAQLSAQARAMKARRILAIGDGSPHASTGLARALPADGLLIVLGFESALAKEARGNFERDGLSDRATVIAGDPARMLYKISGPFDVIFQATGPNENPSMRDTLVNLLRPGGRLISLEKNGSLTTYDRT